MNAAATVLSLCLGAGVLCVLDALLWRGRRADRLRSERRSRLERLLSEAGAGGVRPGAFRALGLLCGLLTAAAAALATGIAVLAVVAGAVGAVVPYRVLAGRAVRRRREFRDAWPDAIGLVVGGVRSGDSLPHALTLVGERGPAALAPHFAEFARAYNADGDFDGALDALRSGLADPIADRVCAALSLAKDTGGREIGRVLRTLADFLRADVVLRRDVEARQSWIVVAARVSAAAPWSVLALLALRPGALDAYRSPAGMVVIAVGAVLTFVGYRLMLRIGRLPEERREP